MSFPLSLPEKKNQSFFTVITSFPETGQHPVPHSSFTGITSHAKLERGNENNHYWEEVVMWRKGYSVRI